MTESRFGTFTAHGPASFETSESSERGPRTSDMVAPRPYQKKVILTLTRQQAEFVSELIIAGAADRNLAGHVAGRVGHGWTTGRVQRSLFSARKKMDLAIRKRDRAQALKEGRGTEHQVGRTMVEIDSPLF